MQIILQVAIVEINRSQQLMLKASPNTVCSKDSVMQWLVRPTRNQSGVSLKPFLKAPVVSLSKK